MRAMLIAAVVANKLLRLSHRELVATKVKHVQTLESNRTDTTRNSLSVKLLMDSFDATEHIIV